MTKKRNEITVVCCKNVVQVTFVCTSEELAATTAETFAKILGKSDPNAKLVVLTVPQDQ